jgi:hypothetical protein
MKAEEDVDIESDISVSGQLSILTQGKNDSIPSQNIWWNFSLFLFYSFSKSYTSNQADSLMKT